MFISTQRDKNTVENEQSETNKKKYWEKNGQSTSVYFKRNSSSVVAERWLILSTEAPREMKQMNKNKILFYIILIFMQRTIRPAHEISQQFNYLII